MSETSCMLEAPCADERPWERTVVRAPKVDGGHVALPELRLALPLAVENRRRLETLDVNVQGRSLSVLRHQARREVLRAAAEYTRHLLSAEPGLDLSACNGAAERAETASLFVGGHQPILAHPGVWVKNFLVAELARRDAGLGLNLIVDNDTLGSTAIRVPAGTVTAPHFESLAFDDPRPQQPWEEATITNRELFASFGLRVTEAASAWGYTPLIGDYWPAAVRRMERGLSLVDALSAARTAWEWHTGTGNLELPLSRLCRLDPFLWFASHLLAHLPRFHAIYNQVLAEYRKVNGVRSRTHPVRDLRAADGWLEAPFWIWRPGDRVRGRVQARQVGHEVQLSDGRSTIAALPLSPEKDACCAVEVLRQLQAEGWRFRTRALTTTLFSRLCLADLFVHGLGGAKYDEMTDRLMTRFFGICPPRYLMLSGTLRLPLPAHPVRREDEWRLQSQLRELEYHAERHLRPTVSGELQELAAEKSQLVAEQQAATARREANEVQYPRQGRSGYDRFRRLKELNRQLAAEVGPERARLEHELSQTLSQLAANAVLQDREYPACLYPADKLRQFVEHVSSSLGS